MSTPMTRNSVILTGLIGLIGAIIITTLALLTVTWGWISPLLSQPLHVWGLFLFLLFFSVAEIPVMVFSMRRIVASVNPKAKYVVMLTNAGYTLFAGVYAAPFILLAGQSPLELISGAFMGALTFVRFISAVIFVPNAKPV
jgi:hypothetical protein